MIINLKSYKKGRQLITLVKKIKKANKKTIVCAQPSDVTTLSKILTTYSQHVDYQIPGKSTGYILPETIKEDGAKGSLLNHSEHPVSLAVIKKTISRCNKLKLKLIVFAPTIKKAQAIKKLKPYAIAFEDPKLVGTGKSITKYKSNDITKFVKLLKRTKIIPMCGAGISTPEDVKEAKKLGCKQVLASSIVAKKGKLEILK